MGYRFECLRCLVFKDPELLGLGLRGSTVGGCARDISSHAALLIRLGAAPTLRSALNRAAPSYLPSERGLGLGHKPR